MKVLDKAGFNEDYRLMQTSLDRPEIMQIHQFMEQPKASCLDLQFLLSLIAKEAKDIQKTVIFVNSVAKIRPMIAIIRSWMKMLNYLDGSENWIRPYYSTISDFDKVITVKAFRISNENNTECTILVAIDAYGMGIDNPDIRLVIQWDLLLSFDSMIQRLGRAGRKGAQAHFVLLTPKWTQVKDPEEVRQRLAKRNSSNAELSNTNRPKAIKPSPLSQQIDPNEISDVESNAGSEPEFEDSATNQLFTLLSTEAEEETKSKKEKKKSSKTDAEKRDHLPDEIFDYIHAAKYRRLFFLAWYDDLTYIPKNDDVDKLPPMFCCNGSGCQSEEPPYLHCDPFVDSNPTKFLEADRKWIACQTDKLKSWRKEKSKQVWIAEGIKINMPDKLITSDSCLLALAKNGGTLTDKATLHDLLQPWYGADEYCKELLECLVRSKHLNRPARREVLRSSKASKKIKYMDNPVVAEKARITALRDQ